MKPPTEFLELPEAKKVYEAEKIDIKTMASRIAHIKQTTFGGRRIVIFSGGNTKGTADMLNEIRELHKGGADGSIIGRNCFQRPRAEALALLDEIIDIYKGK